MKRLLLLFLIAVIVLSGCGGSTTIPVMFAGSVVGVIVDSAEKPVTGANVDLNGSIFTTKEDGKFQFNGVSFDGSTVKIRVNYNGKYIEDNRVVTELDRKNKIINFGNVMIDKSTKILVCGNFNHAAVYWDIKDGIATRKLIESDATAYGLCYSKNTIYTCGIFYNDGGGVCYWEGTKRNKLEDHGSAVSMAIVNDTIYIGGCYSQDSKLYTPCYWVIKNGQKQRIDLEKVDGRVVKIFVTNDGTIYSCGYYKNNGINNACYWKISERTNLFFNDQTKNASYCQGIYFADGIVYSAGWYGINNGVGIADTKVCGYWMGTNFKEIDRNSYIADMTVYNSKIYSSGLKNSEGGFWENETFKALGQSSENFESIKVSNDGTVYVTANESIYSNGTHVDNPKCYISKDGKTSIIYLEQSTPSAYASQIFISD